MRTQQTQLLFCTLLYSFSSSISLVFFLPARNLFVIFFAFLIASAAFAALPAITSVTNPEGKWSSDSSPSFKASYSGVDGYSYEFDASEDTIPDTTIDSTSSTILPGSKQDGIYWFHLRAHSADGWSETRHYKVMIDSSRPTRPGSQLAIPQPDGSVLVSWVASEDTLSGMSHYNVYRSTLRFVSDGQISREFAITDPVAKLVGLRVTGTSFTDTNFVIGEGYRFHYKIEPVDAAGNSGTISSVASVKTLSFCDLGLLVEASLADSNLLVTVNSDGEFKKGHIVVTAPDSSKAVILESASNIKEVSVGYYLGGKPNGDYNVSFSSFDADGDACSAEKIFVYDTLSPEVSILNPPSSQVLENEVKFTIRAIDNGEGASGISKVSLFIVDNSSEKLIGDAKLEGDVYAMDWNTLNYENGRFKVIARATDRGGKSNEVFALYNISNTFFARAAAEQNISAAEEEMKSAVDYMESLRAKNINVDSLVRLAAQADSNLNAAKDLFSKNINFELAGQNAQAAKSMYSSLKSKYTMSSYSTGQYSYNESQLDVFYAAAGLPQNLVADAKSKKGSLFPSRKLEILQVKADSNTFYVANVILGISNRDRNSVSFILIEPFPKQFADGASGVSSITPFEVLRKDPVISFGPFDMNSGSKKEIIYGISKQLTKSQADRLISGKILDYYVSPPIVLSPNSDVSGIKSEPLFGGVDLPQINISKDNLLIVAIAGILIFGILFVLLLLVIAAVYYFVIRKRKK